MSLIYRGLDLLNPDLLTTEELEAFNRVYLNTKGYTLPSYDFWLTLRPDVAKRRLLTILTADSEEGREHQVRNNLAALHYYSVLAYEDGIVYEIRQARQQGATRGHVLDTIAVAFAHAHAYGMKTVSAAAKQLLLEWEDSSDATAAVKQAFPSGWTFEPRAFDSGLDYSSADMSNQELRRLEQWYMDNLHEIPGYVRLLGRYRPALLKAHRNRLEHAIRDGLPKQMLPYMLLYFNVIRGFPEGIREAALLARFAGMTRDQTIGAMTRAMTSYGGPDSLSVAHKATEDVLNDWPD